MSPNLHPHHNISSLAFNPSQSRLAVASSKLTGSQWTGSIYLSEFLSSQPVEPTLASADLTSLTSFEVPFLLDTSDNSAANKPFHLSGPAATSTLSDGVTREAGFSVSTSGCADVAWVNESSFVVGNDDGEVQLWRYDIVVEDDEEDEKEDLAQTGDERMLRMEVAMVEHAGIVSSVAVKDQRIVLSASWDRSVRVWDLGTEIEATSSSGIFRGHDGPITRAIWHPTSASLFTTVSRDGSLKLWDIRKKGGCFETSRGVWDGSALLDISWTDEDPTDCCGGGETIAVVTESGILTLHDLRALAKPIYTYAPPSLLSLTHTRFCPGRNDVVALGGADGSVRVVKIGQGIVYEDTEHHAAVGGLTWWGANKVVSGGWDGELVVRVVG